MKRLISCFLLCVAFLALPLNVLASDAGIDNFKPINTYVPEQFEDVPSEAWFSSDVKTAYELGLMKGNNETEFNPYGNVSLAETIAMVARLHSIYLTGNENFNQGVPWYQCYVDYALEKNIISSPFSDYNAKATRGQFAKIFAYGLPIDALEFINNIDYGDIPDVSLKSDYVRQVYVLYNAGILTGNDKYGTFNPDSTITRCEAATLISRMAIPETRKIFKLEPTPPQIETLYLTPGAATIVTGETLSLELTIVPADAADKTVHWSSSDESIATVDDNGVVVAKKTGVAVISAAANNGVKTGTTITVVKKESIRILSAYASINSVGGASPQITWRNDSGKTIKYATFTVVPYNAVGDKVASTIGGKVTAYLQIVGPIDTFNNETDIANSYFLYKGAIGRVNKLPSGLSIHHWSGETYYLTENDYQNVFNIKSNWDPVWYNKSISSIKITSVKIDYLDGTSEIIKDPPIWRHYL